MSLQTPTRCDRSPLDRGAIGPAAIRNFAPPPPAQFFGYDFVSLAFAVILLIATGLKLQRLVGQAGLPLARSSGEWAAIALEWGMAAWLLWGVGKMWVRRAAMLLLAVFLCVAAWRWHAGDTNFRFHAALKINLAPVDDLSTFAEVRD